MPTSTIVMFVLIYFAIVFTIFEKLLYSIGGHTKSKSMILFMAIVSLLPGVGLVVWFLSGLLHVVKGTQPLTPPSN